VHCVPLKAGGRPLTSADVKYSLERAVNPKTQSPGTGYSTSIAGYDELSGGKAQGMSGITTPDDHTVEIKLSRPDATFLYALSLHYHSARVGADRNVFVDPFDTPLNYRYIYAKDAQ